MHHCGGHPGREIPRARHDERPDGAFSHGVGAAAGALFRPRQRSLRRLNRGFLARILSWNVSDPGGGLNCEFATPAQRPKGSSIHAGLYNDFDDPYDALSLAPPQENDIVIFKRSKEGLEAGGGRVFAEHFE